MRSKKVTRWYCDFCKFARLQKRWMIRHEVGCTANPNRKCKMCRLYGNEQADLSALKAIAMQFPSTTETEEQITRAKETSGKLREATASCPACILSALRQTGRWMPGFDFKAEAKSWMQEYRDTLPDNGLPEHYVLNTDFTIQ